MSDKAPLSTDPYKGVRDFYPEDWARLQACFDIVRKVLREYGYEEYNASPLERAELYEAKTSEEIVNDQTYTFTDRGDRRVTLRPEMTPSLARMVAAKRRELVFPLRWFSIGNRFRYERMQKGRLREFYQVDVDIIGLPGPAAEGEAVVMAYEILRAFGAQDEDFTIRVNSRAMLNAATSALGLDEEESKKYLGLLDRKNKMSAEEFETARADYRKDGVDPLELIEKGTDEAVQAEYASLQNLMDAFATRGMTNVVFDPATVRGFLYYTGLVFEIFDTNPDNSRALFGGGRYDGLIGLFGGEQITATGFAFGDVTLLDFLATHNLLPKATPGAQVFVGTPTEDDIASAQSFAEELRASGVTVLVNVSDKPLGDQVKEAVKRGIPYFVAVGAEEMKSTCFRLKTLASSEEETLPMAGVVSRLRRS
ncbi:MAG TPA: histidine--tRNA ligase [Candidatus Paceibacterota bacterium]|nr:histidine--tRNA ligase [Candidatus Paceibacterota bacterium]